MTAHQVSLEHSKLTEIPPLPIETVEAILFRNSIKKINFKSTYPQLVNLDLSDNKIEKIENLDMIPNIKIIDLSFNLIKDVGIISLDFLEELYLISNDLREIPKIDCPRLRKLDLANNSICEIKNLDNLQNLEELYLANNKICRINNLEGLDRLRIVGLQNNVFRSIDCCDLPESIENIHLDENRELCEIVNCDCLKRLKLIEVEKTKIRRNSLKLKENVQVVYSEQ